MKGLRSCVGCKSLKLEGSEMRSSRRFRGLSGFPASPLSHQRSAAGIIFLAPRRPKACFFLVIGCSALPTVHVCGRGLLQADSSVPVLKKLAFLSGGKTTCNHIVASRGL